MEIEGSVGCVCSPRLSGLKYRKARLHVGWAVKVSNIIPFVLLGCRQARCVCQAACQLRWPVSGSA